MSETGNNGKRVPKRSEKALATEQQASSRKRKLLTEDSMDTESDNEASSTVTGKKQCRTVSSVARAVTTCTPNDSDNEDSSTVARKKQGRNVSNVTRAVTKLTIRTQKRQDSATNRQLVTAARPATTDGESGTEVPDVPDVPDVIDLDNDDTASGNDDRDVVPENARDELGEYYQQWSTIMLHLPFAG